MSLNLNPASSPIKPTPQEFDPLEELENEILIPEVTIKKISEPIFKEITSYQSVEKNLDHTFKAISTSEAKIKEKNPHSLPLEPTSERGIDPLNSIRNFYIFTMQTIEDLENSKATSVDLKSIEDASPEELEQAVEDQTIVNMGEKNAEGKQNVSFAPKWAELIGNNKNIKEIKQVDREGKVVASHNMENIVIQRFRPEVIHAISLRIFKTIAEAYEKRNKESLEKKEEEKQYRLQHQKLQESRIKASNGIDKGEITKTTNKVDAMAQKRQINPELKEELATEEEKSVESRKADKERFLSNKEAVKQDEKLKQQETQKERHKKDVNKTEKADKQVSQEEIGKKTTKRVKKSGEPEAENRVDNTIKQKPIS